MIKNIVLFGGSFDPIHNGHINMALKAQQFLGGKNNCKVIFLPNRVSVWKDESVDANDKLNMIKLAIKDYVNLDVDDFELNSQTENYTYLSIQHFIDVYKNEKIKLYFLIGSDQVELFHLWKNAEEISNLVQLIYYPRPNFKFTNDNINKFKIIKVSGDELVDVSSNSIRDLNNLDIPDVVLNYINNHDLYFLRKIAKYIDNKRYLHSKSVAMLAKQIAVSNNIEKPWRYYIAGILHDVGKNVSESQQKKIETEYKEYMPMSYKLYHQFNSAYIAHDDFKITDEDILFAIRYHATGNKNMSLLAMTVYAADKIDPLRGYDSSDMINKMKSNIIEGFKYVLGRNKEYLMSKNSNIDNILTKQCFECYLN